LQILRSEESPSEISEPKLPSEEGGSIENKQQEIIYILKDKTI